MSPTNSPITIRDYVDPIDRSNDLSMEDMVLASEVEHQKTVQDAWDRIINEKLIEWPQMREDFEAEGLLVPTKEAVLEAYKLVKWMRERNWPLPTGVVADGDGGIAFENRRDPLYQRINIDEKGKMELETYDNCRIVAQHPIVI